MMRFSNIRIVLYYQILITVLSLIVGSKLKLSMMNRDTLKHISQDISKVIGRDINIHFPPSLGYSGGGGASTGIISCDSTGLSFFIKTANFYSYDMLHAEFIGVSDISKTETIKCPKPIACGTYENTAYAVFEKLSFGGSGSPQLFAQRLAALHRNTSPNGKFGYSINNTIGATFQPNVYCDTWSEFWDKYRLGHMIKLAKRDGAVFPYENEVRQKIYDILSVHNPEPSLVHGDLWSGNQGYLKDGEPCIFDPATYVSFMCLLFQFMLTSYGTSISTVIERWI